MLLQKPASRMLSGNSANTLECSLPLGTCDEEEDFSCDSRLGDACPRMEVDHGSDSVSHHWRAPL